MSRIPIISIAPTCIEICSGAGGQALGLEMAGFEAWAHVENDRHACATLRQNRPGWNVFEGDVRGFSAKKFEGVGITRATACCLRRPAGNLARTSLSHRPKIPTRHQPCIQPLGSEGAAQDTRGRVCSSPPVPRNPRSPFCR